MKNLLAVAAMMAATSAAAQAQTDWGAVEIKAVPVAGNIHILYGAGGNIGLSLGEDGAYIVDDQYAPVTEKILAAVASLSDAPVRFVINTHFHGDHTGGNENLGKMDTVIIAHDNVRQRLSEGAFIAAVNYKMEPAAGAALPVVTFNDELSLHLNGEDARVIHVANAHTDGDSIVHFRGSNVIHMGDTFFNDRFPLIDVSNGGSIGGMIAAADAVLAIADDAVRIIPGHGELTDKAGLKAYKDMLVSARDIVAGMKADGKSLEEIQAARPLRDFDARWLSKGDGWTNKFIGFVFDTL